MPSLDDWAAELRLSCTPATVRAYVGAVTELCRHAGKPHPDMLVRADVVAWLGRPEVSSNSRAAYARRIGAWARFAQRPDLVEGLKVAPYRDPVVRVPSDSEVAAMFAACAGVEDRALLLLLAGLGLRRAEAARVRGEDVSDLHLTVVGKGGRAARLPVDGPLREVAALMPARGWWFPGEGGAGHVTGGTVTARVGVLGERAGVGHVTPHQLRRWMATSMSRGGAPLASISRLLRHASISTTMIYVRPDERDLRAARAMLPPVWVA